MYQRASSNGSAVLNTGSGGGTYYYDVTGATCNGDAPYRENQGYPKCASYDLASARTVQQFGTNNAVAIDNTLLVGADGREKYCGKQIRVFKDGVEVAGCPFFVWDGCEACLGGVRIDFSVSALRSIQENACTVGVVPGISWEVTETQVVPFEP